MWVSLVLPAEVVPHVCRVHHVKPKQTTQESKKTVRGGPTSKKHSRLNVYHVVERPSSYHPHRDVCCRQLSRALGSIVRTLPGIPPAPPPLTTPTHCDACLPFKYVPMLHIAFCLIRALCLDLLVLEPTRRVNHAKKYVLIVRNTFSCCERAFPGS